MSGRLLFTTLGMVVMLQSAACFGEDAGTSTNGQLRLASTNGQYNFSFVEIEVRTFATIVGDLTGKRMVVDQNVAGKITTVFPKIPAADIFPVFVSVLESAGCSVVQEQDGLYRVISMGARPSTSAPVIGPDEMIPEQGVYTKIFRLQYANSGELRKLLENKVRAGKEGAIGAIETTNYLIVTDVAESLRRIAKIVTEVDKPVQPRVTEILALKFASADDVATQLNRAMATGAEDQRRWSRSMVRGIRSDVATEAGRAEGSSSLDAGRPAVIVPSPHSNSLVLVGTPEQVAELKRIVALMDVDTPSGRGRFGAIFLKYIAADEAAKTLNTLLMKRMAGGMAAGGSRGGGGDSSGGGSIITIEPHPANNALIVDAQPRDFELVKQLVQDLDTIPKQVLIEIVIAEVSAKDDDSFGLDVVAVGSPRTVGEDLLVGGLTTRQDANALMSAIQTGLFPNGITVGLAKGIRGATDGSVSAAYPVMLNLNAIQQRGKFNILSRIPLLAQNNKDAMASIVNNIPMLKSTVQGAAANLQVIQNIDRVDVGIKLKLTPHINPGGEVMMTLNPTIEAIIDPGSLANNLAPTIAHREVTTTVTVPDGRTLVLSGLMRQDRTSTVRKVPILGSLPIVGWLFRRTTEGTEKTNLIILVTPHVIKDAETADKLTSEWQTRTGNDTTNSLSSVKLDK